MRDRRSWSGGGAADVNGGFGIAIDHGVRTAGGGVTNTGDAPVQVAAVKPSAAEGGGQHSADVIDERYGAGVVLVGSSGAEVEYERSAASNACGGMESEQNVPY